MIRILYAHPIHDSLEDARDCASDIRDFLAAAWDVDVTVTTGSDHFRALESGWDDWVPSVVDGEDWDGNPRFHGVIVPVNDTRQPTVGRGAGSLIEACLAKEKPVYAWISKECCAVEVTALHLINSTSWKTYATLTLKEF